MNYDANGNLTSKSEGKEFWRFVWDYENRLASASTRKQTIRYRYDALGRRIQRFFAKGGVENTKFIYDGLDVIADDNSGTLTKYQNGLGIDNKLKISLNGTARYFLADHLGSTNALTDSSGAIVESANYDSFGIATGNLTTRYQFTGREYDNFTGLYYYRARFYDAKLGRFISEDPIGFAGGDVNLFGYVGNNSTNLTDPSGLYIEATYSQSQKTLKVKEWRGGIFGGIGDFFLGPKREEEYGAFSGCNCDRARNEWDVGGPIPKGSYLIDKDRDVKGDVPWKRVSHRLLASQSGTMSGSFDYNREVTNPNTGEKVKRDNFYLHPGSVSEGCVTFPKTSNLEDGAPWSDDYASFDNMLRDTSSYYHYGKRGWGSFGGTLIVTD